MFDTLPLSPWQRLLLWPGGTFMDWLARTWPEVVIVHGFGFTMESYVFWTSVISFGVWFVVLTVLMMLARRIWRHLGGAAR